MIYLKHLIAEDKYLLKQFDDYKAMAAFVRDYDVSPTAVYNTGRKPTDPRYVKPFGPHYFERITKKAVMAFDASPKPTSEVVNEPTEVTYASIKEDRNYHLDNACCSVISMATAMNISFAEAQKYLANRGRKHGKGANMSMIRMAYKDAGKTLKAIHQDYMLTKTPKLKTISQTCREFSKGTFVLLVRGHILTIKNGVPQDWTQTNSRHRVCAVFVVE